MLLFTYQFPTWIKHSVISLVYLFWLLTMPTWMRYSRPVASFNPRINSFITGAMVDGKKQMTSDGESVRSESPDSTASIASDDVDRKAARRIRTMIQHWQKEFLEAAFEIHQYPTVQQYETLSKQLGLPHYVTKVDFKRKCFPVRQLDDWLDY